MDSTMYKAYLNNQQSDIKQKREAYHNNAKGAQHMSQF